MKHAMPTSGNQLCEKKEFAALDKSQGKLTSTQGNSNTSQHSTRGLSKTLLTFVFYHKGFNDRHLLLVLVCLFHPLSNSWPRGRRLCLYFPQARQTRIHTDTILQNSIFHNVSPLDNHRHNFAKECISYCMSLMHTILPKNGTTHQARYICLYNGQLLKKYDCLKYPSLKR